VLVPDAPAVHHCGSGAQADGAREQWLPLCLQRGLVAWCVPGYRTAWASFGAPRRRAHLVSKNRHGPSCIRLPCVNNTVMHGPSGVTNPSCMRCPVIRTWVHDRDAAPFHGQTPFTRSSLLQALHTTAT
jgi:hypothetical protein